MLAFKAFADAGPMSVWPFTHASVY